VKNTIISLVLIVIIFGVVIFLSSLAKDTDFGGTGYVFLLIFVSLISGIITVLLRLFRGIKYTDTFLYNFIGTFNLVLSIIYFSWLIFSRLQTGAIIDKRAIDLLFFIQFLSGTFILFDIYKCNRRFSKTIKKVN
jgi:hypothetical protein